MTRICFPNILIRASFTCLHWNVQEMQTKIDALVLKVNHEVAMVHEASIFEDPSEGAAWIVGAR